MGESERVYRVGISGSYGGFNLGDEAILESIVTQLKNTLPVEITVFSRNAEDTMRRHPVARAVCPGDLMKREIIPEIERLDLFILGGGGILYDADAKTYLREVLLAHELGVPVMIYAIGAGPLNVQSIQDLVRDALTPAKVITVRERGARRVLEEAGVECEIIVTADPALLLKPAPLSSATHLAVHQDEGRKLVGFSVREPGPAAPDIDPDFYHSLLANAADFIIDRFNADIVFVPMERGMKDLQHSHAVISKTLRPQHCSVLREECTSGQMLELMKGFDFAVGMRLHFLMFAALQGVPFIGLPYSTKVLYLLKELQVETPPFHLVSAGRLIAHIDHFWDSRDDLLARINRLLPDMKKKAFLNNEIAVNLLKKGYAFEKGACCPPQPDLE